ncbi:MAG: DUF2334 domain-containing protein [Defluviitaleaceae bacterium]|nr:DUF2334 domain-containing protein [Defluviitaleaceae bacterium]
MKKLTLSITVALLLSFALINSEFANETIHLTVDDAPAVSEKQPLVPARDMFEIYSSLLPEPAETRLVNEDGELLDTLLLRVDGVEQSRLLEAVFSSGRIWFDAVEFAAALSLARPPQGRQSLFGLCEHYDLFFDFDRHSGIINLFTGHTRPKQLPPAGERHALMRIEDVAAFGDWQQPNELIKMRAIADLLWERDAVFSIAWVPVFVRPLDDYRNDPRDYTRYNMEFVFTIDYWLSRGGELGLHGYTHQRGTQNSIGGHEFGTGVSDEDTIQSFEQQLAATAHFGWTANYFTFPKHIGTRRQFEIAGEFFDVVWPHPYSRAIHDAYRVQQGDREVIFFNTPQDHTHSESDEDVAAMIRRINGAGEIANFFFHTHLEYNFMTIERDETGKPTVIHDTNSPLHRILDALKENGRVVRSPSYFVR